MKFTLCYPDKSSEVIEANKFNDLFSKLFSKQFKIIVSAEDGSQIVLDTPIAVTQQIKNELSGYLNSKITEYKNFNPWGPEAKLLFSVSKNPHLKLKRNSRVSKLHFLGLITVLEEGHYNYLNITSLGLEALEYLKANLNYKSIPFEDLDVLIGWYVWNNHNTEACDAVNKGFNFNLIKYSKEVINPSFWLKFKKDVVESKTTSEFTTLFFNLIQPSITQFFILFWRRWSFIKTDKYYLQPHYASGRLRFDYLMSQVLSLVPKEDYAILLCQPGVEYFEKEILSLS